MTSTTSVLFREIHKNAWLRKLSGNDKKGANSKKGDRAWMVFCVHDDSEPCLEAYSDTKLAATHKPEWSASLTRTVHITPTICPIDDEFEFVITLPDDTIRLTAPSWDVMSDWVDSLSAKLREMRILTPKENVYSRMPENRLPLLPTRDPNSPLPPPPAGPSALLPGIEPLPAEPQVNGEGGGSVRGGGGEEAVEGSASTSVVYVTQSPTPVRSTRPILCRALSSPPAENVTVIQVPSATEPSTAPVQMESFDFNFVNDALNEEEEEFFTPPVTPVLPRARSRPRPAATRHTRPHDEGLRSELPLLTNPRQWLDGQPARRPEEDSGSLYEHVFLPASTQLSPTTPLPVPAPTPAPSPAHPPPTSNPAPVNASVQPQGAPTGRGRGAHRDRRRSTDSSPPVAADCIRALHPAPSPFRQGGDQGLTAGEANSCRLSLREQQVYQLKREMIHRGGVRLQLRRKDCLGSIALVDVFNMVWIAGWKQKEHPMLYNALHIGDQLVSVAGILVQNATDAQRLIRGAPSLYVEFVIKRVPCGRVFALRRESEGQNLGILLDGNTAEIKEVSAGSIAAGHGLSSRTPTLDGMSLSTWVLTEVNGRPLNLFFKEGEVKDRLNAVGLDISLLVQPFDLIKQVKKQLKAMRNYKDYIVQ